MMVALDIILPVAGIVFLLAGLVGCILPVVPGPPFSYIALLLLQGTSFCNFSTRFLIVTAVITIVVTVVDWIIPAWGAKKWGGSKAGAIGATVGLIVGLFIPPVGIIVGPFIGAVVGELMAGRDSNTALKSGIGSLVGFLLGTGCKLAVCFTLTYYFVKELWVSVFS
ncbi:MAG: DUF456 domain-containing protein [Bacteroidales bacterium]|jgi:uncharacterized protein YqgC (DUF456 family)|nr:DUF456 domain-containing protein [Bacteroidales bacterium]